ncbi:MAG: extracellular solute-binding protein [Lachnospiraceae bacterium]|nr:extracellular solute-binding protein [Lachnospiraceae bacterium]
MKKRKLTALALTVCMVGGMVAGCGSTDAKGTTDTAADTKDTAATETAAEDKDTTDKASGDAATLTFGVFETDNITAEIWQNMIDGFEKENPDIKVEKVLATGDDRQAFWKTMLSSGSFPDIVVEAQKLATMDGIFAEVPQDIQDLFDPATLCQYDGKCITVPSFRQYKMQCYYNKEIFKELNLEEPTTWDEFQNVCKTIKDAGKTPLMCGGTGDIWATGEPFWIAEGDTSLLSKYPDFNKDLSEGNQKWNNETTVDVLTKWQDMVNAGYYYEGAMSLSYSQAAEEFKKGTAAMMIDGSWQAAGLDGEKNEDFGVFAVPTIDGSKTTVADCSYWGVSETCKNKDAAFKFIKYVYGDNTDVYKAYLQSDGLYSTTKEPVTYEQGPVTTKFIDNIKDWDTVQEIIVLPGEYAAPSGMQSFMDKSFQNIFNGGDVQSEVESWDTEYQRLKDAE